MNSVNSLSKKLSALKSVLSSCILCPRKCHAKRLAGEKGFCSLTDTILMRCALAHHGEEPPISGTKGAGTLFLSSCNLKCVYCQNFQISHCGMGQEFDIEELADTMMKLQENQCHNIEIVTPTPQVPLIMEALVSACRKGLSIPVVYNCGGYENPDIITMLEGFVDIYLPDFKYAGEEESFVLSGVRDYTRYAIESIKEMVRQVGTSLELEEGIAQRGILIRHLVLPGFIKNSFEVLQILKDYFSPSVPISLMSQYTPIPSLKNHPFLGRRINREEYEQVVNRALDLGFETIFIQEVDDRSLTPDFEKEQPFSW